MPAQPAQPAAGRLESTFERPEDTLHAIQGPPERPWRGHLGPRPKETLRAPPRRGRRCPCTVRAGELGVEAVPFPTPVQ